MFLVSDAVQGFVFILEGSSETFISRLRRKSTCFLGCGEKNQEFVSSAQECVF